MNKSVIVRIWRGDAKGGRFVDYTTEITEGLVVLDVVHKIQATQANDCLLYTSLRNNSRREFYRLSFDGKSNVVVCFVSGLDTHWTLAPAIVFTIAANAINHITFF